MDRGRSVRSKLKMYNMAVSGRDWCNPHTEIKRETIKMLQERAMKAEESRK
jgi:hypothetical protein